MPDAEGPFSVRPLLARRAVRLALSAVLMATLAAGSWRKWPDPIVDFGRELYIPWRLSEGAVFGRDIASLFGPLSQTWNGALFRLAGVSFSTLIAANLVLLGWLVIVVDDFFDRFVSPVAALVATTVLLGVFAFGEYTAFGNYTYVAPYAHEATHGIILCVTAVWSLARWFERPARTSWLWIGGACFGLVQLTKPEPALAAAGGAILILILAWRGRRNVGGAVLRFGAAAALPPLITVGLFLRQVPLASALRTTFGAWISVASGAAGGRFYEVTLGVDDPVRNLARIGLGSIVIGALVAGSLAADRLFTVRHRSRWVQFVIVIVLAVALNMSGLFKLWKSAGQPLPIITLVLLAAFVRRCWHDPNGETAPKAVALAAWAGMSFACLAKMVLNTHLYGYGFTLAMPATVLLAVSLVELAPALAASGTTGWISRAVGVALVASLVIVHVRWSARQYAARTLPVGHGGDMILALDTEHTPNMQAFADVVEHADRLAPAGGTIAVLPEGCLLNYLTRRPAPTRFLTYMPPELSAFGEENMTAALATSPPDVIVLVHKDTREYGVGPFGQDPSFGAQLLNWVGRHYDPVETLLATPFQSGRFGIEMLKRRDTGGNEAHRP